MTGTTREEPVGPRHFVAALLLVVLGGFVLRLAAVIWIPTQPVSDFWSYRSYALILARQGRYPFWAATLGPGYSLWLFVIVKLLGPSILAARFVNCLLSAATIGLAGLLARELFGPIAGLLAASLLMVDPRQILQTGLLASENLAAPLVFAFLLLAATSWRREGASRAAALAGLALGFASLTRPAMRPMFLLWPLTALVTGKTIGRVLKETVIVVCVACVVLAPWGAWNYRHGHGWLFSTTTVGSNLFEGNHAGATGEWTMEWTRELRAVRPNLDFSNVAEVDRVAGQVGKTWIKAHPFGALHLYVRKLELYFWKSDPTSVAEWAIFGRNYWPPDPPASVLPGPHYLKMHPRAVSGLLRAWYFAILALGLFAVLRLAVVALRRRSRALWTTFMLIAGACLSIPALTCVFIVVDRYRWPFEDLLCVLIASLVVSRGPARPVEKPS